MRLYFYRAIILGQLLLRSRDFTSAIVTPEQIVFIPCFLYEFSSPSNFLSSDTKYGHIWTLYFCFHHCDVIPEMTSFPVSNKKTLSIKMTLMVHRINTRIKKNDPSLGQIVVKISLSILLNAKFSVILLIQYSSQKGGQFRNSLNLFCLSQR